MATTSLMQYRHHKPGAESLRHWLLENREHHQALAAQPALSQQLKTIRQFTVARLRHTHRDLLQDPHCGPVIQFLVDDIYGGQDFSNRGANIDQAYPLLARFLPQSVLQTVASAMHLYVLTKQLDRALAEQLHATAYVAPRTVITDAANTTAAPVAGQEAVTAIHFAAALRSTQSYREHMRQLDLMRDLIKQMSVMAQAGVIRPALTLSRAPAKLLGLSDLHALIERGVAAFRCVQDSRFATELLRREQQLLDRVFAGDRNPFRQRRRA